MLREALSGIEGRLSTRRVVGTGMILACIIAMFTHVEHSVIDTMLITGASLIGSTTIDRFVKKD